MGTREKGGSSSPGPGILHTEGVGEGGKSQKNDELTQSAERRGGGGQVFLAREPGR